MVKECKCGAPIESRYKHCEECNNRERDQRKRASEMVEARKSKILAEINAKIDRLIFMVEALHR